MPPVIGDLSDADLNRRLLDEGVVIDCGAVATRVFSQAGQVAPAIRAAYGHYPLIEDGEPANYRLIITRSTGFRRWIRPQVLGEVGFPIPMTPFPPDLAPMMLEMTMNWCVATRSNRYLIFHSAVLERNGRAIILPGKSGQGKSTLCAALATSGWRLFSDEFGLMDLDTGLMMPNVRPVSLKNESIKVMENRLGEGVLTKRLYDTPKGTVAYLPAPKEAVERRKEQAAPVAVIMPFYDPNFRAAARIVPKAEGFIALCGGAANFEMIGEKAFDVMCRFMDDKPMGKIAYSDLDTAIGMVNRIADEGAITEFGEA